MPSLVIYELPEGVVRTKIPLVKCPVQIQCDYSESKGWDLKWSPSGRYLAFPAMWYGASTDLYVYDSHDGTTRQLTNGPDNVAQLAWSPDGRLILMGELLTASGQVYPYTTSMWTVSVSTNDIKQIYTLNLPMPQTLLGWIDNEKFVIYDGTSVANALGLA